jgi:glutaredoxin
MNTLYRLSILALLVLVLTLSGALPSISIAKPRAQTDIVVLVTAPNCPACETAKQMLKQHNIKYTIGDYKKYKARLVPQLYVNGKYLGYGVDAVEKYIADVSQRG